MNEHLVYVENKVAWVAYLAAKYWKGERFDAVWKAMKGVLTDEEYETVKELMKASKRGLI